MAENAKKETVKTGMTKREVINEVSEKTELKRAKVEEVFDAYAEIAVREVGKGNEVVLPGIGKFFQKFRPAQERNGRNPHTGEAMTFKMEDRYSAGFKGEKKFRDLVDELSKKK